MCSFALDKLHAVIKEVSEAEEALAMDETGAQAAGSTEDLEGEGITFTARKASSEFLFLEFTFVFVMKKKRKACQRKTP